MLTSWTLNGLPTRSRGSVNPMVSLLTRLMIGFCLIALLLLSIQYSSCAVCKFIAYDAHYHAVDMSGCRGSPTYLCPNLTNCYWQVSLEHDPYLATSEIKYFLPRDP